MIYRYLPLTVAVMIGACGCAGDRAARSLAETALKTTAAYENAVRTKVQTESAFYVAQRDKLRTAIGGIAADREDTNGIGGNLPFDGRTSLVVKAVEVDTQLSSSAIVDDLIKGGVEVLRDYIKRGVTLEREEYLTYRAWDDRLRLELLASLEKFNRDNNKLASIRSKLTALSRDRSDQEQVKDLFNFAVTVRKKLEEASESDSE